MTPPDPFVDPARPRRSPAPAWLATIGWLLVCALVFWGFTGGEADLDPLRVMMVPVAVLGPVALIWIAFVLLARIDALGHDIRQSPVRPVSAMPADGKALAELSRKLDAIRAAQVSTQSAPVRFASNRADSGRPVVAAQTGPEPGEAEQVPLALDAPEDAVSDQRTLGVADLISALQFPADADDAAGFRALRRAMADHLGRQIVTAAQDVLTLLSQDGLYMDDFTPERAKIETWRRFASGERGAPVGSVGGIRDEDALALIAHRMRNDTIFRDACHHFIRHFDQLLAKHEARLTDTELAALADTRSARAFMLLGRSMGTFD